jgi:hypothetical protein
VSSIFGLLPLFLDGIVELVDVEDAELEDLDINELEDVKDVELDDVDIKFTFDDEEVDLVSFIRRCTILYRRI